MKKTKQVRGQSCHKNKCYLLNTTVPHLDIRKTFPTSGTVHVIEKPHDGSVNPKCIKTLAQFMNK